MTVLWTGGEDVDFRDAVIVSTLTGYPPPNARCALATGIAPAAAKSLAFPGGSITSGWIAGNVGSNPSAVNRKHFGLGSYSQNRGILFGTHNTVATKAGIWKVDGTTYTLLASESGTSVPTSNARFDIHVSALGASGAVDLYVAGNLVASYSGDLSWLTSMDCVMVASTGTGSASGAFIVADEDTRTFTFAATAVSGAGDSNAWDGTYADVDEITLSDADVLSTNGTGNDVLLALANLPAGSYSVKAVREVARAAKSASGTATQISLGIKSGGTVDVDSAHSLDTAFASIDRLMTINPVTGVKFTQSEIDALQFAMRSA